jgi:hypothetical protein
VGTDDLIDYLSPRRGEKQGLAGGEHLGVAGIKEDGSDLIADAGPSWLTGGQHRVALLLKITTQKLHLCCLTAALGALEGDE